MAYDRPQKRPLPKWLFGWCEYHGLEATRLKWAAANSYGLAYWHWFVHRAAFHVVWAVCYVIGTA